MDNEQNNTDIIIIFVWSVFRKQQRQELLNIIPQQFI